MCRTPELQRTRSRHGHCIPVTSRETATAMAREVINDFSASLTTSSGKRSPPSPYSEESEFTHHQATTHPAPTCFDNSNNIHSSSSRSSSSEPSTQQQQTPLSTGSSSFCSEDTGSSSSPDILAGGSAGRYFRVRDVVDPFRSRTSTPAALTQEQHNASSTTARVASPLNITGPRTGPSPRSPPVEMLDSDHDISEGAISSSPGHSSTTSEGFSVADRDGLFHTQKGKKRKRRRNDQSRASSARAGEATTHASAATTTTTATRTPLFSSSCSADQSKLSPRPPGRHQEEKGVQAGKRRACVRAEGPVNPDATPVAGSSTSPFSLDVPTPEPRDNDLATPVSSSFAAPRSVSGASLTRPTRSSTTQSMTPVSVDAVEVLDLCTPSSMEIIDVDNDAEDEDGTRTVLSPLPWRHRSSLASRGDGGAGQERAPRGSATGACSSSGVKIVCRPSRSAGQPLPGVGGASSGRRGLRSGVDTCAEAVGAAIQPQRSSVRLDLYSRPRRVEIDAASELDGNTGDDEAVTASVSPAARRRRANLDDGQRLATRIQNRESRLQEQSDAALAQRLQSEEGRHVAVGLGWQKFSFGSVGDPMVEVDWLGGSSGYAGVGDSSEQEEEEVEEVGHVDSHARVTFAGVGAGSRRGRGGGATAASRSSQGRGGNNGRSGEGGTESEGVISMEAGEGRTEMSPSASTSTNSLGRGVPRVGVSPATGPVSSGGAAAAASVNGRGRARVSRRAASSVRGGGAAGRGGVHGHIAARGGGRPSAAAARRRRQFSSGNAGRHEGQFAVMMSGELASLGPFMGGGMAGGGMAGGRQQGSVGSHSRAGLLALMNRNLTSADYHQLLALDDDVEGGSSSSGSKGLSDMELSMLPTQKGNGSGEIEQCCICMDDMKPRQSITRLPACLHTFHSKCIAKWLKAQATCPIDKACVCVSGSS